MLDKMAEMVREDKSVLCDLCPYIPNEADCINAMVCPSIADIPEDRLARWVVLLVARALEKEIERLSLFRGLPPSEAAMEAAAKLGASIYNLITEAKEGRE